MFGAIVDVLFPPRCFGCGVHLLASERAASCCGACQHTVHAVTSPMCPRCAMPREVRAGIDTTCARCLASPPGFAAVHARWIYDGAVSDAIRRSKASGDPSSMFALIDSDEDWFAELARQFAAAQWTTPPVHPGDLVARGWDPARAALRRACARRVEVADPLHKVRTTTKQAHLGRSARAAAMRGAFACIEPIGGNWVVFDDVMTTGATLHEAARALRRGGASNVIAVVVARSV